MSSSIIKRAAILLSLLAIVGQSNSADLEKQIPVNDDTFKCLSDMTKAGDYFVDNLLGNIQATLDAANSETGATFPPGSVVSLVPNEAMVKHQPGWDESTNDWEFFLLDIAEEGSTIASRGTTDIGNQAGTCLSCHQLARPEWDLICGTTHGCAPLPFTREQIQMVQGADLRCRP
jgi:hypothetical protein